MSNRIVVACNTQKQKKIIKQDKKKERNTEALDDKKLRNFKKG